jgi:hypothetical protein
VLRCEIAVVGEADRLLYEGLPLLMPVLDELDDGALLIGGLATTAWLLNRPVGMPTRATRDVDLGMNRAVLGLQGDRALVANLLKKHHFEPGYAGEAFRFSRSTESGEFVVDLLVAPGASRSDPPIVEPGIPTLAAPGLAYAIRRGPLALELRVTAEESRSFLLRTVQLDAAFVLKAALVASSIRMRPDRRITDTVDAIMLAAACTADQDCMRELAIYRGRSDVKDATGWIASGFSSPESAAARRISAHFEDPAGAEWAVRVSELFGSVLQDHVRAVRTLGSDQSP